MRSGLVRRWALLEASIVLVVVACAVLAQQPQWSPNGDPVARTVNQALRDNRYVDAEKTLSQAIPAAQKTAPNPQLSFYLRSLASLTDRKGDLSGALVLAQRALQNQVELYGSGDIRVASDTSSVAFYLQRLKRSVEAEQLFKQAVDIALHAPATDNVDEETRGYPFASLGSFYSSQGRTGEAVQWYEDALKMCPTDRVSPMCNVWREGLADLYRKQGRLTDSGPTASGPGPAELSRMNQRAQDAMRDRRYVQAEIEYRNAIDWIVRNPGPATSGYLVMDWTELGRALEGQGRNDAAEEAYKKAVEVHELRLNPKLPPTAYGFPVGPLARLYAKEGRVQEAEALFRRALALQEKILGPAHAYVAETLLQLARMYDEAGKTDAARYSDAAAVYERALKIQEKTFGAEHPDLQSALLGYAAVLRNLHQDAKAAEVQARINALRNRQ